ncbi:MAG: MBL fold metallo-hydrolase [Candidatus Omnitrophica bacterium]|nr:MBL fold metallo-hydrolase [Candidatus Omnitrophota bacterium]
MRIYLKQLELGPLQNFVYLIGPAESAETAVVDPGWDVPGILKTAERDGRRITAVLVTHTHFDHINGVAELVSATDVPVYVHKKEEGALPVEPASRKGVEGGYEFSLGPLALSFLHTPGHTPGSLCVSVQDKLITGDTLFIGGCGRCDLPGGDPELLHKSLVRLSQMDDRFIVHPGHNYASQPTSFLKDEKRYNPFLQAKDLLGFMGLIGAVRK